MPTWFLAPIAGLKLPTLYSNPIPTRFLAPIDCSKILAENKTRQPNISIRVSEKTTFDVQTNHFVKLFRCCFVKPIFSAEFHSVPFRSVPNFGIGSSAELGMPRNEGFLPRNIGNRSESIPRNFFGTKFRSQP
jgi:hypothetical protein